MIKTLFYLSMFLFVSCSKAPERLPETYILPKNYVGSFIVIYRQLESDPVTGEYKFVIPDSGILVSDFEANAGWIEEGSVNFYFESEAESNRIPRHWGAVEDSLHSRKDGKVYIFLGGLGVMSNSSLDCDVTHSSYFVGTKKDLLEQVNFLEPAVAVVSNDVCP